MRAGLRGTLWERWRLGIVVAILILTLAVLGSVAVALVRSVLDDGGPSITELDARLRRIGTDPTLTRVAPGAKLVGDEPVLCADSSSPHRTWRYAYEGPFESVATFYDVILRADRWVGRGSIFNGGAAYDKEFSGWTAEGIVQPVPGGYSVVVTVDNGYESGCAD